MQAACTTDKELDALHPLYAREPQVPDGVPYDAKVTAVTLLFAGQVNVAVRPSL